MSDKAESMQMSIVPMKDIQELSKKMSAAIDGCDVNTAVMASLVNAVLGQIMLMERCETCCSTPNIFLANCVNAYTFVVQHLVEPLNPHAHQHEPSTPAPAPKKGEFIH